MNKVNPLYIVLLIMFLFLMSIFKLNQTKIELQEAQESYEQTNTIALDLLGIKKVYEQNDPLQKSLAQLVDGLKKQGVAIEKIDTKKVTTLSATEMKLKDLDTLVGKILNSSYVIKSLKIEKIDQYRSRFYMEIQW